MVKRLKNILKIKINNIYILYIHLLHYIYLMAGLTSLFGNWTWTWTNDEDKKKLTSLLWEDTTKRQDKKVSLFGFDEETQTSNDAIQKIKEEADKTDRTRYWIAEDIWDSTKWLFGGLSDLAEYWWTKLTNKNEDWWINDFKKFNEYQQQMNQSESEDEYWETYQKMIDEWVINKYQYNQYLSDQKSDKKYWFNQAVKAWEDVFASKISNTISPIMKQATNRYQIDAITKGTDHIISQYNMAYENVMNAYYDTHDPRILDEWNKISKEYEDAITEVTKKWSEKIVTGKTYWEAYSETIQEAANKELANDIVSLERTMTNKLYDYTIDRNFNDAGEYASSGELFHALNSTLLWAKNYITWWLQQVNFWVEEAKQFAADRYDVTEELANLYVFDEDASWVTKTLWWAKWVGNWVLDSLPQLAPVVWELWLTRKVPWKLLKSIDKWIDTIQWIEKANQTRVWFRRLSHLFTEWAMDNLVYDTSFQTIVQHPITWEEENLNLLFNWVIDSAQALLQAPAKFFNNWLRPQDIIDKNVSADALKIAKNLTDDNLNLLTEELVLLRWREITQWSTANKKWLENSFNLDELRKTEPDLVAKYEKIQQAAYDYADRIQTNKGNIDDLMLTIQDIKSRWQLDLLNSLEKLEEAAAETIKRSKTIKALWDYIFSWAKSVWQTFAKALADWRLTEADLRLAVKKMTNVNWVDDLILWLAKHDAALRDAWLAKISESWKKLTREDINEIYNWTILDILEKNNWDILKEDEWLGKFKKNNRWEYVDVYWVMRSENWNDEFATYTYDEVKNYLKRNMKEDTIWAEKFRTYDNISDAYNNMMADLANWWNVDWVWDATPMFNRMKDFNLSNYANKTVAEKNLLNEMLRENWFKIKLDDNWNIISIYCPYANLNKLYSRMSWLQSKWIDEFDWEDLAAYKMLFFWDIYSSFRTYMTKVQLDWGNVKDLQKEFKTFFEKQFEENNGKYTLKAYLQYDEEAMKTFKDMFWHNATFKEIENEAANNLIKNILKDADIKDINDQTLYNRIHDLVCKWHYLDWKDAEALPIVNSLFNQAKWMRSLWMWDNAINEITRVFWELVVDDKTITALSLLNSDYLYKSIISKLILENDLWAWIYKDAFVKLFNAIWSNVTDESKELIESLKSLTNNVNKLTSANVSKTDKELILNNIQDWFKRSQIKTNIDFSKSLNKDWVTNKNWIFKVKDASNLSDNNINDLSTMIAVSIFRKNNLPEWVLFDKLKKAISNTLENARTKWGKLEFSVAQWLKESEWAINLTLLGDIQLAQLLKHPDNMLKAIISKWHLQRSLAWIDTLSRKWKLYDKVWVWDEYREVINWLKWLVENWYEKTNDELVKDIIELMWERWITDKWNVMNKLVDLYKQVSGRSIQYKKNILEWQLDDDIERIENLINIMNLPWNPKGTEEVVQKLYNIQQLLERAKTLSLTQANANEFQKELSKVFDNLEQVNSFIFEWAVSTSKTAQRIWDEWTNLIFKDANPYDMKWKWLKWKKIVIIDTETSWLEEELYRMWKHKPEITQLSYRVLEIWNDGTVNLVWKPKNKVYKLPDAITKWAKKNYEDNIAPYYWYGKTKFGKTDELFKDLKKLSEEWDTYFVWHNIDFDLKRLSDAWLKIDDGKTISTDLLSSALLPVWVANHKQETLRDAFEPIQKAIRTLKDEELKKWYIKWWDYHNAVIDTLELQEVFWYLMDNAIRNKKTTEDWLLDFMLNTTKDMRAERKAWNVSSNALPFYRFEHWWSFQSMNRPRNKRWTADYTFDMPFLLQQMFWSNSNRKWINEFLDGFKSMFWERQKAVNIHDVIDSVADKLWDERSLYILHKVKDLVWANEVIDINKVLMWDEVKSAFIKAQQALPNLTFSEYCTNRLVANILSSVWQYNEWTINSLNRLLESELNTITIDKLVKNNHWTLDTSAFVNLLNVLNDNWIIKLWEKWTWEYSDNLNKILWKIRWTQLERHVKWQWWTITMHNMDWDVVFQKATKPFKEKNWIKVDSEWFEVDEEWYRLKWEKRIPVEIDIEFYWDSLVYQLSEFNKALSDYIKWNNNVTSVWYAAKNLIHQLFWKRSTWMWGVDKEWNIIYKTLHRWWEFPELMWVWWRVNVTWEFSRSWGKLTREEEKELWISNLSDVYEWYTNEELKSIIDAREKAVEYLKNYKRWEYTKDLKEQLDNNVISAEEYNRRINTIDKWARERWEQIDRLEDEIRYAKNQIEVNNRKYEDDTELWRDMWTLIDEYWEEWEAEKWLSQKVIEMPESEGKEEVENSMIESQSAVDTLSRDPQQSSLESRVTTSVETMLEDSEFMDNIYWKDWLIYDNLFLIDETEKSIENYINTSYNWIVDILWYWKATNKNEMISHLEEEYAKLDNWLATNNKVHDKVKEDLVWWWKWKTEEYKKTHKKNYYTYKEWEEKNAEKNFIYNSISTLKWERASSSPQKLADIYWFDENLIWAQTNKGTITRIDINVNVWKENLFADQIFWKSEFKKNVFLSKYIDALNIKDARKCPFVKVSYTVEWSDWIDEVTEWIKPKELFDTSFGKYILKQYWVNPWDIPSGEYNKLIPAISMIKKGVKKREKWEMWNIFRQWDTSGKYPKWPRYKWQDNWKPIEDIWVEGINYSPKKYLYVYDALKWNKELQDELINITGEDIAKYIDIHWTKEIDNVVKKAWYNTVGDLIYNKVILEAAKWGKKNMKEWWRSTKINNMMKEMVKDDVYKENVDAVYTTPWAYYKLDNWLFTNDKSLEYDPMIKKILDFETTAFNSANESKHLRIVWFEPQFYKVKDELEVDNAWLQWKGWSEIYVPDNINDLWKNYIDIVYPWKYVSSPEERNALLREMDADANDPRQTFEYVHDMDDVKVLAEDDEWNLYEWILDIKRFSKVQDEDWKVTTTPWQFRLLNLTPYEWKEWFVKKSNEIWLTEMPKVQNNTVPEVNTTFGWWMKIDWENSHWKLKYKEVDENKSALAKEEDFDRIEQSSAVKVPTDTMKEAIEDSKHELEDWEIILNNNPQAEREKQVWNTRLLNFTNYDVVNQSEELKQIVWLRNYFISQHWEDLRKAVDEFNEAIKEFGDEDQERIYDAIRDKARDYINNATSTDRRMNPGIGNMQVYWLPTEVQNALNKIWEVFRQWDWNPQYQYAMLSKKNDWFEWILKNIWHNHKWAAAEYLRITWKTLRDWITDIVRRYVDWDTAVKNMVSDVLWDPLGTSTMNKMLMGVRSMWRFIKYGPVLYPLSWVMMLANSAILWVMRYWSESKGFRGLMGTDAFNRLIAKKWDQIKLSDWKIVEWLGFTDAMNRTNEIMFNSNSDLWWTWFDKCLDTMLNILPDKWPLQKRFKEIATTAMKWGTHSLFDLFAQWSVKTMEFAKALEKNLVWWWTIDDFVKAVENKTIDDNLVRKILADTEKWYSRFFTNSATSLFSRHKFSRRYMFNALQWYVINRTDEIFSSIKDAVNWIWRRWWEFSWNDFTNYLHYNNQELKWLMMNVLLSAKLGFYMDRLVNWWEFSPKEYSDYMIDTSDYLSSLPATFFYSILTAPLTGIEDYTEYVKKNNEDFDIWDWLTVAWLNTISQVMQKFFREGKVLNAFTDSIVAFGKTGNIDFAYDVLESEFSNIANWLWRFQLTEWTHKYWLDYLTEEKDLLWQLLFNSDKVSNAWQITQKLYWLQTVDWILNWENWDWWKNRLLPYIPVLWQALQNSITGSWYTFTQAKWKELQHIMDKDAVIKILNNWEDMNTEAWKELWRDEKVYSDDAVSRMYKELTAFDYPNKAKISWTDFKTGYEWELEQIKETVFTDEILRWLNWTDKDLENYLNSTDERKKQWLLKIMAAAQAARPWSSKIVLSYLANQEEYALLKKVTGKDYPSSNDVTPEEMSAIQRQVLQDYYPYMFMADKTSRYKAITEYVSWNYEVFKDLYKDDDMTWYLSTLWYMDMIMYQQARDWNVNAKYIKNAWTMLSKYFKSEPARMNAIAYTMNSIENSWFSRGKEASAKMWVLVANMDFYDRIQKNWMMNALYWDDIERYNQYVWWVLDDINKHWLELSSENKKSSWKRYWNKYYTPYSKGSWLWDNNVPLAKQFVPAAQDYLKWWTPSWWASKYNPTTYGPSKDFNWYWKYYEGLIKTYSDRLVKSEWKKYPAETIEGMTFKTGSNNRWSIRWTKLTFPKHKSKEYRTNVISNLPGSHW